MIIKGLEIQIDKEAIPRCTGFQAIGFPHVDITEPCQNRIILPGTVALKIAKIVLQKIATTIGVLPANARAYEDVIEDLQNMITGIKAEEDALAR